MKNVLVIGSGGREHAIVLALAASEQVGRIYCAPGNAGIGSIATNVPIKDTDVKALKAFALENAIDLTVVGPEVALAAGIADQFRKAGLKIRAVLPTLVSVEQLPSGEPILFTGSFFTALIGEKLFHV